MNSGNAADETEGDVAGEGMCGLEILTCCWVFLTCWCNCCCCCWCARHSCSESTDDTVDESVMSKTVSRGGLTLGCGAECVCVAG